MTKSEQVEVAVKLDNVTHARLNALRLRLSKDRPMTESELLREVLLTALEKVEKEDSEQLAEELRAKH
jgi:hypothetical protein